MSLPLKISSDEVNDRMGFSSFKLSSDEVKDINRSSFKLSSDEVKDSLGTSFKLSSDEVKDSLDSSFYQSSEEVQELCDPCRTGECIEKEAIFYCQECKESLCGECREFHRKLWIMRHHNISRIDESTTPRQSGKATEIPKSFKNLTLDGTTRKTHAEQMSSSVKPFRKATLTNRFNVSMADDEKPCLIYSVLVQDNLIYVADHENGKIKLFDMTGHAIAHYIKRCVFDLTSIRKDMIACTSLSKYFTIIAKEGNTLRLVKTIPTTIHTRGIFCYNGLIYISCYASKKEISYPAQIHVFTPDGELKRRIEPIIDGKYVLERPNCFCINKKTGTIYVSDFRIGVIVISSAGKVHFIKQVFDTIGTSVGVSIDDEGQLYICGTHTNNVLTMSADGSDVFEILNKECGNALAVEIVGNLMYLCCRNTDIVRVFTLSK